MALLIKPINQFTLQKTDTPDGSYFGFDWFDGTEWQTAKILSEDLAAALSKNFANANLTATGNRSHDFNNFSLEIKKCSQIKFEVNSAPPISESAVKITGYGSSSSDISFQLLTNVGTAFSVFGNLTTKFNGKVYVNTNTLTGGLFQMEIAGTNGILSATSGTSFAASSSAGTGITSSGAVKGIASSSVNGVGVEATTTGTGTALNAKTNTGLAARIEGQTIFEEFGAAGTPDASALVEFDSNVKGILVPRMTTLQKDAIPSPTTSLLVYDSDRARFEFYNGSYWRGLNMRLHQVFFTSWSPTDAQTVAFGSHPFIPVQASISPAPFEIVMRGNGVIRGCDLNTYASGVAGSNEAWSLYVRHNGTDYLVQTLSLATGNRVFTNQSLNIPFVDGDIVRMIFVNPTWATNPTNVAASGSLNIQ